MSNQTKTKIPDWVAKAINEGYQEVKQQVRLADTLVEQFADAIEVLRARDGVPVTRDMAVERARNQVAGLLLEFKLERILP